jgi:hypothetical protein
MFYKLNLMKRNNQGRGVNYELLKEIGCWALWRFHLF